LRRSGLRDGGSRDRKPHESRREKRVHRSPFQKTPARTSARSMPNRLARLIQVKTGSNLRRMSSFSTEHAIR
jgi:hypothetical protein